MDDIPDAHVHLVSHGDRDAYRHGDRDVDAHHVVVGNRDASEHLHRRMLIGLHPVSGRDPCA